MKNIFIALLITFVLGLNASAQNMTEKNVKDSANGISFTVPKGWICQETNGIYIFTDDAKTANIILKKHNYKNYDEFTKGDGAFERDGFQKTVKTSNLGNGGFYDIVSKSVDGKEFTFDVVFLVSKKGGGEVITGVSTDKASTEVARAGMAELFKTLTFQEVKTPPQDSATQNAFAGKKFRYLYSNNGYRESRTITLCKSGSYFYQSESGSISSLGGGFTNSNDRGTWQVQKNGNLIVLTLRSQAGNPTRQYQVSARQASNEIGLNNDRFFVSEHNECQ
jgi:hypothetical protein